MKRTLTIALLATAVPGTAHASSPAPITIREAQRAIRIVTADYRATMNRDGTAPLHFGRCTHQRRSRVTCRARVIGTWQTCSFAGHVSARTDITSVTIRDLACRRS